MIDIECTTANLGPYEAPVYDILRLLEERDFSRRIWAKDPSLWKESPAIQEKIKNRLGWLSITERMTKEAEEITAFAASVIKAGFTDAVLLGMGGSSLCPEVLKKTFGSKPGYLKLTVLDTTDPETILSAEKGLDLKKTLFIVASKSGGTIEAKSLYSYFSEKLRKQTEDPIGDHFIAITDPGTPLAHLAGKEQFRALFLAPPDVGGRYSALTPFGLVPAALIGIDLVAFLARAQEMIEKSGASVLLRENPAILLGAMLGSLCAAGRDKMTLIISEEIASFGLWAEQLVAESTGKEGKGVIPIDGEPVEAPILYGDDRLFVYLRLASDSETILDQKVALLQQEGYPVIRVNLRDRLDLAGEFFRWQMATAVIGGLFGTNPFDEPNVSESKEYTATVLEQVKESGQLALPEAVTVEAGISLSGDLTGASRDGIESLQDSLKVFLGQAGPGQYVALMAYLSAENKYDALLQRLRSKLRKQYGIATTLGYGPRFLHSTGQLHKGGGRKGLFLQITAEDQEDIAIPETSYSFGILKRAQALGDFSALKHHDLPVLEIRLSGNIENGLARLLQAI